MIYPYKYLLKHNILKLHEYVEYFFDEMYKRKSNRFSQVVIHKDFLPLTKRKEDLLLTPMKSIYREYKKLDDATQKEILDAFKTNNSIAELCNGKKEPWKYENLEKKSKSLSDEVKVLFSNLYTKIVSKRVFESQNDHFKQFRTLNETVKVCPFCGLEPLLSRYDASDGKKDDYDHWLSKGKYPFNSVNFKNLVPMCGRCNQKYKTQKDTIFEKNDATKKWDRRLVFYPYGKKVKPDTIEATIEKTDGKSSLKDDDSWTVKIEGPAAYAKEVKSWSQIFGIESRYKNRIRDKYELVWFEQLKNLYKRKKTEAGFTFSKFKEDVYFGIRPFHLQEGSIVEKTYYDFLFSDPNFQTNLEAVIG
ncbi:hypothetical protein [Bizionia paragorgiae]|uniref:hypothetical protein n=1 Tax=Bizionia paragorgiae TaxID=283786 RepID=UPI003A946F51